ncbi:pyruvate oxidase [Virgibacillus phasianinus]|uniref:Pyruvate oxidase n=1 Tax=Virgibacillus phasianinus TaxID=2017483 RepID=A0A220TYQ4_9BACI|nr:thiamine pyrophosphate-binding protein [Virgibacillus phasianinus]ASK60885.1 pyruvate oxidase [Virgibacillus phasianinus]
MPHKTVDNRNVAQHLIQQLKQWDVKRIYGVIGDGILFLLDELGNQEDIQYIACRHEMNAALMASAEAKLTGKMAVCTATSGPGITVLLNGLADAWRDRASVLVITGQVERTKIGTGDVQDINQQQLIAPLAEYSSLVTDSHSFPELLNIAMKTALSKGGVAHLSVPTDIWTLPVNGNFYPLPLTKTYPQPESMDIKRVSNAINQAQRPIILAGRGIQYAQTEAIRFAEKLQVPIMVTMPAKPFIANDHPLFIGGFGQAGTEISRDLLKKADLCVVLGATWWPKDYVPSSVRVIQIDSEQGNIGLNRQVTDSLVGNLAKVIPALTEQINTKSNPAYVKEIQEEKDSWNKQIQSEIGEVSEKIPPAHVFAELGKCINPDAVMAVDTGDHTLWLERIFQYRGQELLVSGRWRTLGFGLPAGIAAQLTFPGRQVVCIAGDGGVAHSIIDLITAVTYKLPITLIIINNNAYFMETSRMVVEGLNRGGSQIPNPDYVALAKSMGAEGERVEKAEGLVPAFNRAFQSNQTTIVEVLCSAPILPHTKILKGMDTINRWG